MNKPTTFEEACTLALRGHRDDLPLSELREAANLVANFDATASLTAAQHEELSAVLGGMLGAQFRHRDHPLNAPANKRRRRTPSPTAFTY